MITVLTRRGLGSIARKFNKQPARLLEDRTKRCAIVTTGKQGRAPVNYGAHSPNRYLGSWKRRQKPGPELLLRLRSLLLKFRGSILSPLCVKQRPFRL